MTFRYNETKEFPTDRTDREIWYGMIRDINGKYETTEFTSSKSSKEQLIVWIEQLKDSKERYLLIGIWKGNYKTDLFILDPDALLKKLKMSIK